MYFRTTMGVAFAALYLLIGGFTYGATYGDNLQFYRQSGSYSPPTSADMASNINAVFWPIYWPCHLGYQLSQ